MSEPVPLTKGLSLISLVKMARKKREAFERFLPAETRVLIGTRILTGSWYPEVHLEKLLVAADRVFGKGNLELCRAMGKVGAQEAHSAVYKTAVVPGDPAASLALSPGFWSLLHNTGTLTVETLSAGHIRVTLTGYGHPSLATCQSTTGWFESKVELAGGVCRIVEERCRTRGEDACVWDVHWTMAEQAADPGQSGGERPLDPDTHLT